jgi:putative membrane protein
MDWIIIFIATWLITTVAFIIITKLPTGVESDSLGKTAFAALIFGVLNAALTLPILKSVFWLVSFFGLLGNVILFAVTAKLVEGFRLRWGIWSALIGAFLLTVIGGILKKIII